MNYRNIAQLLHACTLFLLFATAANAQNQQKIIEWSAHPRGSNGESAAAGGQLFKQLDIIEIEEVRVEGTPVIIGQPFIASADWLNNISFRVKNVSNESLRFLQISLTLPQLKKPPQIPYVLVGCTREKRVCVEPGQEVELRIPALALYDWVKTVISEEKLDLPSIDKATIDFVIARLANGNEWSSGCAKTMDPLNACPHREQ